MLSSVPVRVRLGVLLLLAAGMAVGCDDNATGPKQAELVPLGLQAIDLEGQVALLVVEVTGPGQLEPIIGNFAFEDGRASGVLEVALGLRHFEARAYHQEGFLTHQGATTQVVRPGDSEVKISLVPVTGDVHIDVTIGAFAMRVEPAEVEAVVGEVVAFAALVTGPDGATDTEAEPIWGSSHLGVAEVDASGAATVYVDGEALIAASYGGVSATALLKVRSPFRDFPVELEDGGAPAADGLGTGFATTVAAGDDDWPFRLHGFVVPDGSDPEEVVWAMRIQGAAQKEGEDPAFPLLFSLAGAVTPSDLVVLPTGFVAEGGRSAAVEAAVEITEELEKAGPDLDRVAELVQILIALMGGPAECPDEICGEVATAPSVLSVSPSDGAQGASVATALVVSFDQAMDPSTLTGKTTLDAGPCSGTVQASTDEFATCIPFLNGTAVMSGANTVATLTPAPGLAFGSTFRVRLTQGAASANGVPMGSTFETPAGFTTALDDRDVDRAWNESGNELEADFCSVHHPTELVVAAGVESDLVFGRLFEEGLTNELDTAGISVRAELGFGPRDRNPQWETGWTFVAAHFEGQEADHHVYSTRITPPHPGLYGYVYRFSLDYGASWTYCDASGSGSGEALSFETPRIPVLTVTG
jgi:hypothetical protein